jgi:ATP/maltotriose-dependent transcriptional regulator MalT
MPMVITTASFLLQDAIFERPSLDELAARLEATELDPVFENTWSGAMLREVRGRLRLARHDRAGGIADLRATGRAAAALHYGPALTTWQSAVALALPVEEREEAVSLVARELQQARASGMVRPQGIALRAAGILEGGKRGVELLHESASLLEGSQARLEHARSLVELGGVLRRLQRRAEARPHLEAGMDLARHCGAERLTARALEELRAAGGKPRRMARSGRDALTASEMRVATLAADGVSNPEIAQELFVSLKTIETHLSHAYAKLGLSGQGSRGRLAVALDEAGA